MTRHMNKTDMTITEQLESMKEKICRGYCKYPDLALEVRVNPADANEWLNRQYCERCPLREV